jgi:hypothetical protein
MPQPISLSRESVVVVPAHVRMVLGTLARQHADAPEVGAALAGLAGEFAGRDPDAAVWLLPAEALCLLAVHADALGVYGLDANAADTYRHPYVAAELRLIEAVREQAPRTWHALRAVMDAETVVALAG